MRVLHGYWLIVNKGRGRNNIDCVQQSRQIRFWKSAYREERGVLEDSNTKSTAASRSSLLNSSLVAGSCTSTPVCWKIVIMATGRLGSTSFHWKPDTSIASLRIIAAPQRMALDEEVAAAGTTRSTFEWRSR